jgi:phosphonatase-like hydrolase
MTNDVELVIFDLAGTTVKADGQVAEAFAAALSEHGVAVTPEQLSGVRGSSKRQAVLSLVPAGPNRESIAASAYDSFRGRLARSYREGGVEAVEGAEAVFRWLKGCGVRVALNTGFDRHITELILTALKWREGVADALVCGDDVRQGRPAPDLIFRAMELAGATDPRRVVNVGDTALDLRAGDNARVGWNVGVLSGAHGRGLLESAPHTHLLESVADLPRLWPGGLKS